MKNGLCEGFGAVALEDWLGRSKIPLWRVRCVLLCADL